MGIIKKTTRFLRKNQTESEKIFWEIVRKKRFKGKKFLRQYPIKYKFNNTSSFFVADFYCHEYKLIIEIDGGIHQKLKERDEIRDLITKEYGFNILRFSDKEIINNQELVINKLSEYIR